MRWAELRMCRFWAGGISSFPFSRAREYRLLRRLNSAVLNWLMRCSCGKSFLFSFISTLRCFKTFPSCVRWYFFFINLKVCFPLTKGGAAYCFGRVSTFRIWTAGRHNVDMIFSYQRYDVSPFNIMSKFLSGQLFSWYDCFTVGCYSQSENMKLF
jgi:hypothetical protein